jgi:hypothetical protein
MDIVAILLPALGIAVIILMLVEIREWRSGRSVISSGQAVLRLAGGFLLLGLLTAIFLGLFILGLRRPVGRPILFLAWWSGCLALAIVLLVISFADMRRVAQRRRERETELWRDFARVLAERIKRERGDGGGEGAPRDDSKRGGTNAAG